MKTINDRVRKASFVPRFWHSLRRLMSWFFQPVHLLALLPGYIVCRITGRRHWRCEYEFNKLFRGSRIVANVNNERNATGLKRALLVYIVGPFLIDGCSDRLVAHTNVWRSREIANALGELGYVVDAMDYNDYHSKVSTDYDLLLGFGRAEELAKQVPQQSTKIRLATGSEANFHNQRERERVHEVNKRRGCRLQAVRRNPDKSAFIRYFDAVACLGNEATAATYRPFFEGKIHCFNNHGYDHLMSMPEGKDFRESRRNFLYFAGGGQVLNGLDLLLEVFALRPHLSLYVCGPFANEASFVECFRKELYETPNIFPIGWVAVGSSEYSDLVRRCGMVIAPICSGASHGSVVVCMGKGLVPLVTKEAGIDTDGLGITLPSFRIEDIASAVDWISTQPPSWHEEMSRGVLCAAGRDFSQAAFSKRFREILSEVIRDKTAELRRQ